MNNTIQYKGYVGSVEFSEEDSIFYGKVLGIRSLISYEGENAAELLNDFHDAVDDYLKYCKASEPRTIDSLTNADLDAKLSHSYAQAIAGEGKPLDEVFDELEKSLV